MCCVDGVSFQLHVVSFFLIQWCANLLLIWEKKTECVRYQNFFFNFSENRWLGCSHLDPPQVRVWDMVLWVLRTLLQIHVANKGKKRPWAQDGPAGRWNGNIKEAWAPQVSGEGRPTWARSEWGHHTTEWRQESSERVDWGRPQW